MRLISCLAAEGSSVGPPHAEISHGRSPPNADVQVASGKRFPIKTPRPRSQRPSLTKMDLALNLFSGYLSQISQLPNIFHHHHISPSPITSPSSPLRPPPPDPSNPLACLDTTLSPTLTKLVACFEIYTVPGDFYTDISWAAAQPTSRERKAWFAATRALLHLSDNPAAGTCTSLVLDSSIADKYALSTFTDSATSTAYCVLAETHATRGFYNKGWGVFIVPATRAGLRRNLHISAPHPIFDEDTPAQAAAVFAGVGGKSLYVPGRHRRARNVGSLCVPGTNNFVTDPAHDLVLSKLGGPSIIFFIFFPSFPVK